MPNRKEEKVAPTGGKFVEVNNNSAVVVAISPGLGVTTPTENCSLSPPSAKTKKIQPVGRRFTSQGFCNLRTSQIFRPGVSGSDAEKKSPNPTGELQKSPIKEQSPFKEQDVERNLSQSSKEQDVEDAEEELSQPSKEQDDVEDAEERLSQSSKEQDAESLEEDTPVIKENGGRVSSRHHGVETLSCRDAAKDEGLGGPGTAEDLDLANVIEATPTKVKHGTLINALTVNIGIVMGADSRVERYGKVVKHNGSEEKYNKIMEGKYYVMAISGGVQLCEQVHAQMMISTETHQNPYALAWEFETTILELARGDSIKDRHSCGILVCFFNYSYEPASPNIIDIFYDHEEDNCESAVFGNYSYKGCYTEDMIGVLANGHNRNMSLADGKKLSKKCINIAASRSRSSGDISIGGWFSVAVLLPCTSEERALDPEKWYHITLTREERVVPQPLEKYEHNEGQLLVLNQVEPQDDLFDGVEDFWNNFDTM